MTDAQEHYPGELRGYKRISDYGVIGNSQTVALVGNDGSIDWLCLPYIDSPSVFGALLDPQSGGRFILAPSAPYDSTAAYLPRTCILTTTFRTTSGLLRLLDFMPVDDPAEQPRASEIQKIYRCLEVTAGDVEVFLQFEPRFDYARAPTELVMLENSVTARSGSQQLRLLASQGGFRIDGGGAEGVWHLTSGGKVWFLLVHGGGAPEALTAERMAFWINLFNVMVIHGVIELGVRDSVREVPRFFRRIRYLIGGSEFSADDIEHGILRGNHRLPHSLFHPFDEQDPRRSQVIAPIDPRIHFALVCASSSCPPIEIYNAETLDQDLEVSGKTFLNSGGVRIDCETCTIWLPKVFDWYGEDFGGSDKERLLFVAPYLYSNEDRQFLEQNAGRLRVKYDSYDWRLNRV